MGAACVGKPSPLVPTVIGTSSSTLGRGPMRVLNVGKPLSTVLPSTSTIKSILQSPVEASTGRKAISSWQLPQQEKPHCQQERGKTAFMRVPSERSEAFYIHMPPCIPPDPGKVHTCHLCGELWELHSILCLPKLLVVIYQCQLLQQKASHLSNARQVPTVHVSHPCLQVI